MSLSAGECGLKLLYKSLKVVMPLVTLRRRVWIEISKLNPRRFLLLVTLRRRVWIEIFYSMNYINMPLSLSAGECGLK